MTPLQRQIDRLNEIEGLARLGYAARGLVYLIVGWFAVTAAYGSNRPTDTKGALVELFQNPFGSVLLALTALGLAGYALWRVMQAVLDVNHVGTSPKGLVVRAGFIVAGVIHAGLAIFAIKLLAGQGGGRGDGEAAAHDWTAWLLTKPMGRVLVAAVGAAIIGTAVAHAIKAYKASFRRELDADPDTMKVICPIGRFGFAAKGLVFAVVGSFFLVAAWQSDSSESGGLLKALQFLQQQPYGPWLLGVVAAGLFAFGAFSVVQAVYCRIDGEAAERQIRAMV